MIRLTTPDRQPADPPMHGVDRKNIFVLGLIGLVVVSSVFWVVRHWSMYSKLLAETWPILVGFLVVVAMVLELKWWIRFDPWYYQTGPKIRNEEWQTSGTNDQIREAIRPVLNNREWTACESLNGFFIRRAGALRFDLRIAIRLEDTDQGTLLRYEVRPILCVPLLLLFVGSIVGSWFRIFLFVPVVSWLIVPSLLFLFVYSIAYYLWLAPRKATRMARLAPIRSALAKYRMGVCEKCGYDLFGHLQKTVCPECGTRVSLP